jgi:hypothetical protein
VPPPKTPLLYQGWPVNATGAMTPCESSEPVTRGRAPGQDTAVLAIPMALTQGWKKSGLSAPDGVSGRGAVDCSDIRPNVTVCSGTGLGNAMVSPG